MSATELPMVTAPAPSGPIRDEGWMRAAQRARQLSWASLVWMSIEGIVGLIAGFEANSLSLIIIWAASSFVEGLASMTIIWRFTGSRVHSETSERTAQKWVAGSFLLLVPYFLYESFERLLNGSDIEFSGLGAAVTGLGDHPHAVARLGQAPALAPPRLGRDRGRGHSEHPVRAAQAAAALVALIGAGAGLAILDPIAALVISGIAIKECVGLWRGEGDDCCAGRLRRPERDRLVLLHERRGRLVLRARADGRRGLLRLGLDPAWRRGESNPQLSLAKAACSR